MEKLISKKLALLNQTNFQSFTDDDNTSIIRHFIEVGIKILEADFGFAWAKFNDDKKYKLIYKSSKTPPNPTIPKIKPKYDTENKKGGIFFDENVKKENYESGIDHLRSYIIVPLSYGHHVYGSMVFCYKKKHNFTKEELLLAETKKNNIAHVITINWLIDNEQKVLALAEKQKETQILLDQEKVKTEFIANAAHEFRTPLAIMRGNVELALSIKNGQKKAKSSESALRAVKNEINHLTLILADLATLISTENHKEAKIVYEPVDVRELVTKIVHRLQALAHKKKISLRVATSSTNNIATGNEEKLEKLFINLIRNAIIYGKNNGKVLIDINKTKKEIIIKVTDDGDGIPADELPHIFERFYRTKRARAMTTIGTGLGLAIAKGVAISHGGKIEVTSTMGVGSTFTVSLPIKHSKN